MTPPTTVQRTRSKARPRRTQQGVGLREEKIKQVRERIASGYYDRPDVQRQLAKILLEALAE